MTREGDENKRTVGAKAEGGYERFSDSCPSCLRFIINMGVE